MPDWSREEVEATVADYFAMLAMEVAGQDYNKSSHRTALKRLLNDRSDSAIEWKHQNITAVLNDIGFPGIPGYKRRSNYQQLLYDVVEDRLASSPALRAAVKAQVSEPADVPAIDDILESLVNPPAPMRPKRSPYAPLTARERHAHSPSVDYLALEARNQSLGSAGEEFVKRFEIARLLSAGHERLAQQVEHVSRTRGDGLGYDVLSFETSGRERLIEVKTTAYGKSTPFYVSPNEVDCSREMSEQYFVYRPFEFRRRPRLFWKAGAIDASFSLTPSQFAARIR